MTGSAANLSGSDWGACLLFFRNLMTPTLVCPASTPPRLSVLPTPPLHLLPPILFLLVCKACSGLLLMLRNVPATVRMTAESAVQRRGVIPSVPPNRAPDFLDVDAFFRRSNSGTSPCGYLQGALKTDLKLTSHILWVDPHHHFGSPSLPRTQPLPTPAFRRA